MTELLIKSEAELPAAAKELLESRPDARVFAISGEMGAGKTTFIKALCKELGVPDIVQSPTFAIVNEYKRSNGESVFHIDFYRIKKAEEAYDIGYEDYVYSGNYCFIEWPELVEGLLPEDAVRVNIAGTTERTMMF
jgi:tRNA threonylcarbamoyladenosine biosynthesis protein TsaE